MTADAPDSRQRATASPLGNVDDSAREALGNALARAYAEFDLYRARFREAGLTEEDARSPRPMEVLRRLPILHARDLPALFRQSLAVNHEIIDVEASSGTSGVRKRRPITYDDAELETRLLTRAFDICGVVPEDRVACLDTGPLTLMASFTEALDRMGTAEAYAFTVSPDSKATAESLAALDPTVIMTVPSVLERVLGVLRQRIEGGRLGLRAVVYAGEPLAATTRARLEAMGVGIFSYYGSSETSTLGVECRSHLGLHLFTDAAVIECAPGGDGVAAEVIVTTLYQQGLPLLRYSLQDRVRVIPGPCPCGLSYPRVEVLGRADDSVSVLGVQLSYHSIREAVYGGLPAAGPMQAVLTGLSADQAGGERDTLVLRLPDTMAKHEKKIRESLLVHEPDIAFLIGAGLMGLRVEFADEGLWTGPRKAHIADERNDGRGAGR